MSSKNRTNKTHKNNKGSTFLGIGKCDYGKRMGKLKYAEREIKEIANLIRSKGEKSKKKVKIKSLLGKNANKDNIKGKDFKRYNFVHFAVHSRIEEKRPFHSSLILTKTSKNDGYLKSSEIFNLEFDANLIVLSACKTAYGKLIRGEGVESLTRAIMYAGTPSVIVTLWKIPDKATYIFMKRFYKNLLSGKSKLQSLRATKLSFLKSKYLSAPYYWAAFVLYGKRD